MHSALRLCSLIACCTVSNVVLAWGSVGHEAVGALADQYIAGTNAEKHVTELLANVAPGLTLKTAAVWADCAKGVNKSFHYVVNPRYSECQPFETEAGQARMVDYVQRNWDNCTVTAGDEACHKQYHYTDVAIERDGYAKQLTGTSDHDIVSAINAAIVVLQGGASPAPFRIKDQTEALLLLSHYVGDVHQPLHVAAVYLDRDGHVVDPDHGMFDPDSKTRGGNDLDDGSTALHMEWDGIPTSLNASHLGSARIKAMRNVAVTSGPIGEWSSAWASDTLQASKPAFDGLEYAKEDGRHHWAVTLPNGYAKTRTGIQRGQLIKAGARLGQLLEAIWP